MKPFQLIFYPVKELKHHISTEPRLPVVLLFFFVLVSGCAEPEQGATGNKPSYLTTIPPFAFILQEVTGKRAEVTALLSAGSSPHTYEPRPSDVRRVGASTALFYGAAELDGWATDLDAPARVALMDLLPGTLKISLPERMEGHGSAGVDPHFWMDPLAVRGLLPALTDTLCGLDPPGCREYQENAQDFAARLDSLHMEIDGLTSPAKGRVVLMSEPFLLYYTERYGIRVGGLIEPFPGKEPSARALRDLVTTARESGAHALFIQVQLPTRGSAAISEAAGIPVYELDPLGGGETRNTYSELIRYNTGVVVEALK